MLPEMKLYLIAFMSIPPLQAELIVATETTGTNKAFRSHEQKFDAPAPNPCFTALLDADSDCSALTANTLAHKVIS